MLGLLLRGCSRKRIGRLLLLRGRRLLREHRVATAQCGQQTDSRPGATDRASDVFLARTGLFPSRSGAIGPRVRVFAGQK